jgi:sugar lactone lactonase YvrE
MSLQDTKKLVLYKLGLVTSCALGMLLSSTLTKAQTASLLQLPSVSVAAGIPAPLNQTVCSTALDIYGNGCPPTAALLSAPVSTAIDGYGNIYIADSTNKELRVIYKGNPTLAAAIAASDGISATAVVPGYIYNLVGGGTLTGTSAAGTAGAKALLSAPVSVALDTDGNVFFGDNVSRLRIFYVGGTKVAPLLQAAGVAVASSLIPGYEYALITGSTSGYSGDGGQASKALGAAQKGLAVDSSENVYIADSGNNALRKITASTGIITTYLGSTGCVEGTKASCTAGDAGDGGPVGSAETTTPWSLTFDANGNLYLGEEGSGRVRAVYMGTGTLPGISNPITGNIYLIAGGGTATASGSSALNTSFDTPKASIGVGLDPQGNVYVADGGGGHIWRIDAATQLAVIIAGGGSITSSGAPCSSANPTGSVSADNLGDGCVGPQAELANPEGNLQFDVQGNLYFADNGNNVLRTLSRTVLYPATPVGTGSSLKTLGFVSLTSQTLGTVTFGVQGDSSTDYTDGGASTCMSGAVLATGSNCLLNAKFTPALPGLRDGYVQLTNSSGSVLRSVYLGGDATGAELAVDDGTQTNVGTNLSARGLAVDPAGNIYVADGTTSSLLEYAGDTATTPSATLITGLSSPGQVAVDGEGNVYVADTGNNRVDVYNKVLHSVSSLNSGLKAPQGVAVDNLGDVYVADTGNSRIVEFLPSGNTQIPATSVTTPTRVTFDGSSNLYILDASNQSVEELPEATGAQATITTANYVPVDIAFDAAGDLYVLDSAKLQVGVVEPNGITYNLVTGLTTPSALAVDAMGDVYVADTGQTQVIALNRQSSILNFNYVQLGTTTAGQAFTLTDIGNTNVQFTSSAIASPSGNTSVFSTTPSSSGGCSSTTLTVASQCALTSVFSPIVAGTYTSTLTFPSNAGATNATTVTLTGIGKNLASAPLTLALSSPASSSNLSYGTPLTLSITLNAASGTPTGTIKVLNNGSSLTTIKVVSGTTTYSYTFTPNAGNLALTAVYSGDQNFASSNSSLNLVVAQAATTTTLTLTPSLSVTTPIVTLTAQVTAPVVGLQGAVTFYNGSTVLATVSLSSSGVASYTTSNIAFTNLTFSATYNGSSNFATSTSKTQTLGGDFGFTFLSDLTTPSATVLDAPQGGIGQGTLTMTPYFSLSGNVTFSCSGLPAYSVCRVFPQTVTFPGTNDQVTTAQIQVFTNVIPSNLSSNSVHGRTPRSPVDAPVEALTLLSFALFLGPRRSRKKLTLLAALLVFLPATFLLSGCNSTPNTVVNSVTPVGQYPITVTATSQSGATHSINLTFNVIAN